MEKALQVLMRDYDSLNSSQVSELHSTPTPVEFSRFVAANRPVVIRGQGQREGIVALEKWTDQYLVNKLQGKKVAIAVSPDGNADSIVEDEEGDVFAEPATIELTLEELLSRLDEPTPAPAPTPRPPKPVYYLQSQNGNLVDGDFSPLVEDVGTQGPSFAREVFGESPDAVNLWIGDQQSVTSMHKDPYENIYLVIRGSKTFTLLPPTSFYALHESIYPHASYSFDLLTSTFTLNRTSPPLTLPWIPVDPVAPNLLLHPRFAHARPLEVTLKKGDMLYLPALWFHRVAQDVGWGPEGEGVGKRSTIAVNWWSDMRMEGSLWSMCQLVRRLTLSLDGREEESGLDEEEV